MNSFKTPFVSPVATLSTARLLIRVDSEESYLAFFRTHSDADLLAWGGFATVEELEKQKEKIQGGFSTYRTSTVFFHLTLPASGQVIGAVSFHNWYQQHRRSEIGYLMSSAAHKNQGFMREALPAVLAFGFGAMHLNRVEAFISPTNQPSRRLVGKAGFQLEGRLRQHHAYGNLPDDSLVYGLLREEWPGRPAQ